MRLVGPSVTASDTSRVRLGETTVWCPSELRAANTKPYRVCPTSAGTPFACYLNSHHPPRPLAYLDHRGSAWKCDQRVSYLLREGNGSPAGRGPHHYGEMHNASHPGLNPKTCLARHLRT
jgi:hypothetical protein